MMDKNLAAHAPRGSAKSTILCFLRAIHAIAFKETHFIIIIQNTFSKAAESLETIKEEVRNNKGFTTTFPIKFERDREGDAVFIHPDGYRVKVLCFGYEQIGSIRGQKFGAYRPGLILGDDIEDDTMVKNADRRKELGRQFDDVLKYAGDDGTKFIIIGTVLHEDALIARLISPEHYKRWHKLFFQARFVNSVTHQDQSLWPEKWTLEQLSDLEKEDPISFAKEMQGDPSSGMAGHISKDDFRYWTIEGKKYVLKDENAQVIDSGELSTCRAAIACDLAWETKRESDSTVIMPGYLTPTNDLLIDSYVHKKGMRPNQITSILFEMSKRLKDQTGKSVPIGFEKAKLEKVQQYLLKQEMKERNEWLWLKDLKWDADKVTRMITRLQPRYVNHSIFHRGNMGDYEHQLLKIPSGVHDDLPDAAQGLCQLLVSSTKRVENVEKEDNHFEYLRKQLTAKRNPSKHHFVFGNKGNRHEIPAKTSYR